MSLKGIAKETLQILEDGRYVAPSGRTVSLEPAIDEAIGGTRLWRPAELAELLALAGAFERVVFAILDRTSERRFLAPFEARFVTSA